MAEVTKLGRWLFTPIICLTVLIVGGRVSPSPIHPSKLKVTVGPGLAPGMSKADVLERLGKPTIKIADKNLWLYQLDTGDELSVIFDRHQWVEALVVLWTGKRSAVAISLNGKFAVDGTTSPAIAEAKLGRPSKISFGPSEDYWIYQHLNLTLVLDKYRATGATLERGHAGPVQGTLRSRP